MRALRTPGFIMKSIQLTSEQRLALDTFKVRYGARWKLRLIQVWKSGAENKEHYGKVLKQLRTSIGPGGLERVNLS